MMALILTFVCLAAVIGWIIMFSNAVLYSWFEFDIVDSDEDHPRVLVFDYSDDEMLAMNERDLRDLGVYYGVVVDPDASKQQMIDQIKDGIAQDENIDVIRKDR